MLAIFVQERCHVHVASCAEWKDERGSHRWAVSLHNHFSKHGASFTQGLCESACINSLCPHCQKILSACFYNIWLNQMQGSISAASCTTHTQCDRYDQERNMQDPLCNTRHENYFVEAKVRA